MVRSRAWLVLPLTAALAVPTGARASALPEAFELSGVAVVTEVSSTQEPAASIITAGLVDATAGFASSALRDGGSAESIAAPVYPGDLVAGGPELLCQELIPCPAAPPAYPLAADAAYPTQPTAQTPGPAGAASGRATAGVTDTQAHVDGAAVAGLPFTWGAATAVTHSWVTPGAGHVVARSVVHDLTIGPLHIDQLASTDLVDVPVSKPAVDRPSVEVTGVSLAGQSASIDEHGVHVAGQTAGQTAMSLEQQGLSVTLLGTSRQDSAGAARSAAGGLEVGVSVPVKGVPSIPNLPGLDRVYVATVRFGGVGISAAASSADPLDLVLPAVPLPGSVAGTLTPPVAPRPVAAPVSGSMPRSAVPPPTYPTPQLAVPVAHISLFDLSPVAEALAIVPTVLLLLWRLRVGLRRRVT